MKEVNSSHSGRIGEHRVRYPTPAKAKESICYNLIIEELVFYVAIRKSKNACSFRFKLKIPLFIWVADFTYMVFLELYVLYLMGFCEGTLS